MPLDEATVATLLAQQGYAVPDDDLREITASVNDLVERALSWDAVAPFDDEPWATWPLDRRDG